MENHMIISAGTPNCYKFCVLSDEQSFPTFRQAYVAMHKWVQDKLDKGQLSFQVLETMIWIECPLSEGVEIEHQELPSGNSVTGIHPPVLYFYDARDRAYDEGILVGHGELVE